MKKRFGFTLAEVLITLGIIGVVAAMTIPTLIQNTNSVKFQTQFKKSVSTLSQAALMAQAQHDMDYSQLTGPSVAGSGEGKCDQDSLATPNTQNANGPLYTMCGLFNSTLAGQTYLGTYGEGGVPNANANGDYTVTKVSAFNPAGYLIYSLADGSFVGFDKDAFGCGVQAGTPLTAARLTGDGALAHCIGFIDVNGPTTPNKEVTCADGTAAFGTDAATCALAEVGRQLGDVYPIVFHDGTVEPATNAARAALTRAK